MRNNKIFDLLFWSAIVILGISSLIMKDIAFAIYGGTGWHLPGGSDGTHNFQYWFNDGILGQFDAYSCWATTIAVVFGCMKIHQNLFKRFEFKTSYSWLNTTLVFNLVGCILFLMDGSLNNLWDQPNGSYSGVVAIRSIIGHYVIPLMILLYFILFANEKHGYIIMAKNEAWKTAILVFSYAMFILFKYLLMTNFERNSEVMDYIKDLGSNFGENPTWKYPIIAPYILGWPVFVISVFGITAGHYASFMILNALNNISFKIINKGNRTQKESTSQL
ncbi:hypothetical protein [[Acholeplasma] multilocale]|uniref:hypothetical protein n=1 Tax=[Acholeplasma] multilocale TaxID=264638 RepID=UPI00047EDEA4|nr:hypothetical protein [[Acholeplasma] multilocale]